MSVFTAHFTKGTHAARPAASAVPEGGKYACSDHGLVYESDGVSAWSTWFDPTNAFTSVAKTFNVQTGATYTAVLADANRAAFLTLDHATAVTFTIPTNASVAFPVGSTIEFAQLGAGQVTITPAGGVTINGAPGLKIADQFGVAALVKIGTNTWLAMGRLAA